MNNWLSKQFSRVWVFVKKPIFITSVIGTIFLGSIASFSYFQYETFQNERSKQQAQFESAQKEIDELKASSEDAQAKQQSLEGKLKEATRPVITTTYVTQQATEEVNIASIVEQWENRVAEVTCEWEYSNGMVYARAKGSAAILYTTSIGAIALTNRHVITDNAVNGTEYPATRCLIKIYGVGEKMIDGTIYGTLRSPTNGDDWAQIELGKGQASSLDTYLANLSSTTYDVCTDVNVGDKLIIMGFPAIGTQGGITVTEGIVSGIEDNGKYYVTSAKIERGNSGGVAVLLKGNCYLGIPTWASSGSVESLARILSGKYIYTH